MNADPSRSFCPQCQADWDRPWHDVCPACGHRCKARPWLQSPWLALGLICLPALAILACSLLPNELVRAFGINDRESIAIVLTLPGSALTALPAGILLACRLKPSTLARVLLSIAFVPALWIVSVGLSFFACAAGLGI